MQTPHPLRRASSLALSSLSAFSALILLLPGSASAQWTWAKPVSISAETHWDGMARDEKGNTWFAGVSSRLPQPDTRAFVVARYRDDTTRVWTARLVGGGFTTRHSEVGFDSVGNVYAIGVFTGNVRRADSTVFTHFLNSCFIAKYDTAGKEVWVKKLTTLDWTRFQVLPDGTIGLLLPNFNNASVTWGDSAMTVPKTDLVMEISPDGAVRHVLSVNDVSPSQGSPVRWVRWTAPGKIRFVHGYNALYANEASVIKVSEMDLAAKTFTHRPDSATATSSAARELGFGQFEYDEATGHLFALVSVRSGSGLLNGKDSLAPWPNNLLRLNHLVEFDEKMAVARRIAVTNPAVFAVRDSQVALAAMVHRNAGFLAGTDTIKTRSPDDAHLLYVMDREFRFRKKGHLESPGSGNSGNDPRHVAIAADGSVFLHMTAAHSLSYHRAADTVHLSAPLSTSAQITGYSKLGSGPATGLVRRGAAARAGHAARLLPGGRLRLEAPGAFAYVAADPSGRTVLRGQAVGRAERDLSALGRGLYVVRVTSSQGRETFRLLLD